MDKKYLVLSLSTLYAKKVAESVSNELGMFFLSVDDFIEYTLLDSAEYLKKCGKEHYLKKEKQAISSCLDFENMIFSCSYDVFVNNLNAFDNFEKVYCYLPKDKLKIFNDSDLVINEIAFEDRNKLLKSISKFIDFEKESEVITKVKNFIGGKL